MLDGLGNLEDHRLGGLLALSAIGTDSKTASKEGRSNGYELNGPLARDGVDHAIHSEGAEHRNLPIKRNDLVHEPHRLANQSLRHERRAIAAVNGSFQRGLPITLREGRGRHWLASKRLATVDKGRQRAEQQPDNKDHKPETTRTGKTREDDRGSHCACSFR